ERLIQSEDAKTKRRKLIIAASVTGGLCLLLILFAGLGTFMREGESQFPAWFMAALADDRKSIFRSDAFRSFALICGVFLLLLFGAPRRLAPWIFYAALAVLVTFDIGAVDKRYFTKEHFKRKKDNSFFNATAADEGILQDKAYYRVYNLQGLG